MRTHARRFGLAAALVSAVCLLADRGGAGGKDGSVWKQFLPPDAYKELVQRAARNIEEALAGKPDEEAVKRAQFNALMIAGYTLSTRDPEAGPQAALREAARAVAKLVSQKGKEEAARKAAAALLTQKAGAGGKADLGNAKDYLPERADLMEHFKTKSKGGEGLSPALQSNLRLKGALNGIEEKLRALSMKRLTDAGVAKEAEELALFGYRAAVVGELTYLYAPETKTGKTGDPKEWRDLSLQMRDAGIALAEAAKKKDADAIFKASNNLNSSCGQCHSAFRL
ncbi:MAG: cytochrome c [Gemmataceae bacterium]|nr:cytochrome c [Gemmataceae bacterium]